MAYPSRNEIENLARELCEADNETWSSLDEGSQEIYRHLAENLLIKGRKR